MVGKGPRLGIVVLLVLDILSLVLFMLSMVEVELEGLLPSSAVWRSQRREMAKSCDEEE